MNPVERVVAALEAAGSRGRGSAWTCPAHEDRRASLSVREGRDSRALLKCHAGCSLGDVLRALGLDERDLFPEAERRPEEPAATYDYVDEEGRLLFQVLRYPGKRFRQRRPDGRGGWAWNLDGARRVPYRLPAVLEAARAGGDVWVVEGEKDVEALERLGLTATTNPGGAGKWRDEYAEALRGARVRIIADRDEPGRRHAREVAASLRRAGVEVMAVLEPTRGKDVADHLAAGGTVQDLVRLEDDASRGDRRLLTAAEILADDGEEGRDHLVEGLLEAGGLSVLAARPKAGKSTLSRALAVAVAQGREFLGRRVRQGPVLLVSLEDRRRDVARHLRRLGLQPTDPLLVATAADGLAQVEAWVREHRPVLVVVDTIARLVRIRDYADYGEVTKALDGLLRLARSWGAHVLLLHHAPKGSDGRDAVDAPLGSTAIAGTVDVALHLKRAADGTRTLSAVLRAGEDLPESVLELDADGWPALAGTKVEIQRRRAEDQVLAFLEARGEPASREEVIEAVGGRAEVVVAALASLVEAGLVGRTGAGRRGDPYRFSRIPFPPFPIYSGNGGTETAEEGVCAGQRPRDSVPEPSPDTAPPGTESKPPGTESGAPLTAEEAEALERLKRSLGAAEVRDG